MVPNRLLKFSLSVNLGWNNVCKLIPHHKAKKKEEDLKNFHTEPSGNRQYTCQVSCTLVTLKQINREKATAPMTFRMKHTLKLILQEFEFGKKHVFINEALVEKLTRDLEIQNKEAT